MNNDKKTPQEELLEEVKQEEAAGGKPQEEAAKTSEASPESAKTEEASQPEEQKAGKKKKIKMPSSLKKALKSRRFQRGGIATAFTAIFIVVVILVNVVVSLLSDRFPSMNIDLTANQVNTLSEEALDVAKDVQYETNIYIIASDGWIDYAESYGYPYSTLISITDRLVEANSKIHVETIDLETNPTFANEYADESLTNGCVVVETEKRYRVLTTNDLFPSEQNSQTGSTALYNDVNSAVASALQQVNLEKVPLISIATGHSEMLQSTDLDMITSFFNDYAFDVQQFDILTEDIPEDTRILYIPTPALTTQKRSWKSWTPISLKTPTGTAVPSCSPRTPARLPCPICRPSWKNGASPMTLLLLSWRATPAVPWAALPMPLLLTWTTLNL